MNRVRWTFLLAVTAATLGDAAELTQQLRRPVALVFSANDHWLYAANRQSGTLSVINLRKRTVVAEAPLSSQPSALLRLDSPSPSGPDRLIAVDESEHQILVLHVEGPQVEVVKRVGVARHPVDIVALSDDQFIVSSLWSRRLTRVDLQPNPPSVRTMDMPWAPRKLLALPNGKLLVSDAFGGQLGIVDPQLLKLEHTREFPAHNIRGLAMSSDGSKVVIAHQMLNELAHTIRNDVHWGLLMSNDLRYLSLKTLMDPAIDIYEGVGMHPLGEAGNATSDPAGLAVAPDGTAIVTLGGVGEIAFGKQEDFSLSRLEVGRRPTAVTLASNGTLAAVANTFEDSVTLIDVTDGEVAHHISLGPTPKLTLAEKGQLLFYDGELSHDRWMSCHSCHPDGHTNGQLNDNLSDFKTFGAPKRVLSLLGKRHTAPFAWNGGAGSYAEQISNSISQTMQSEQEPKDRDIEALTAFLLTLDSPPSIDVARQVTDAEAVRRGQAVFARQDCHQCHAPPGYTTPDTHDVGLEDELGHRQFNPPSLLGVGQRGPYFHDGRAKSLQKVFGKHRHQLAAPLSERQLQDLLAFLRSL